MTKKGKAAGAGRLALVDAVAAKAGITKENALMAIKSVQDGIIDLLVQSGRIQLAKFGIFSLRKTAARNGRNPATGQPIKIPPGLKIGFKVSKTWKNSLMARNRAQDVKAIKPAAQDARAAKSTAKAPAKPAARKSWKKR